MSEWEAPSKVTRLLRKFHVWGVAISYLLIMVMLFGLAEAVPSLDWLIRPLYGLWVISPFIGTYVLAKYGEGFYPIATMFVVFLFLVVTSYRTYYVALYQPGSSTDSLILIFMPIYQWIATIVIASPFVFLQFIKRGKLERD